jgi:hypothetical protein
LPENYKIITLANLKQLIDNYSMIIHAPQELLPTYSNPGEAQPNVDMDQDGHFIYEIFERGLRIKKEVVKDENDLCFLVFNLVTFMMAANFELEHRIEDRDSRRIMFDKQEELLGQMREDWKIRKLAEHQSILKSRPFDDPAGLRAGYIRSLMNSGVPYNEARRDAYKKYPSPNPTGEV